jgi:hypothetical protein
MMILRATSILEEQKKNKWMIYSITQLKYCSPQTITA